MSEHPPSAKRLREATARGEIAHSSLLSGAAAIAAGAVVLKFIDFGPMRPFAERAFAGGVEPMVALREAAELAVRILLPMATAAWLASLLAGVLQTGGRMSPGAFGRSRRRERNWIGWLAVPATVLVVALDARRLASVANIDSIRAAVKWTLGASQTLVWRALLVLGVFAAADLLLSRVRLRKRLWMTREELSRERREEEGDPRFKAERRRRHRDLSE